MGVDLYYCTKTTRDRGESSGHKAHLRAKSAPRPAPQEPPSSGPGHHMSAKAAVFKPGARQGTSAPDEPTRAADVNAATEECDSEQVQASDEDDELFQCQVVRLEPEEEYQRPSGLEQSALDMETKGVAEHIGAFVRQLDAEHGTLNSCRARAEQCCCSESSGARRS